MSVKAWSRVWAESGRSGSELLMLLAIADHADDAGRAYPSVAGLAEKCRMKPRNANYVLADLRQSGELRIDVNAGPKGKNRYQIVFEAMRRQDAEPLQSSAGVEGFEGVQRSAGVGLQSSAPLQGSAPLQSSVTTPALQCAKPLHSSAAEPSLNRQGTVSKRKTPLRVPSLPCPDDVDQQVWTDWGAVRKAKGGGPITTTVLKGLESEAAKAGLTLQQALEISCRRNWIGFEAGWLKPADRPKQRRGSFATTDYTAGLDTFSKAEVARALVFGPNGELLP